MDNNKLNQKKTLEDSNPKKNTTKKSRKSRLEQLKQKREQINKRIQKMEALEKHKARKQDTRRKILIGSYYIDKAKKENSMDAIIAAMDKFLKRETDRVLFNLHPLAESVNGKE